MVKFVIPTSVLLFGPQGYQEAVPFHLSSTVGRPVLLTSLSCLLFWGEERGELVQCAYGSALCFCTVHSLCPTNRFRIDLATIVFSTWLHCH